MDTFIKNLDLQQKGLWFPVVAGVFLFLFMVFMPKRLSWRENLFAFSIIGYLTWMIDNVVAKTFDLFDLGNPTLEGVGDIITFGIIPSCFGVIFLNFLKQHNKWRIATVFATLSILFEWGMIQVGYMKLKGWHTWWSLPVYLFMYGIVIPWIWELLRDEFRVNDTKNRYLKMNVRKLFQLKEKAK